MNIKTIMSVAIGGFLGGITRYELSVLLGDDGILYASIGYFLVSSLGGLALALLGFMLARKYGGPQQDD